METSVVEIDTINPETSCAADEAIYAESAIDEENLRAEEDENTIFVGDLPIEINVSDLTEVFQPFGNIADVQLKVIRGIKFPFGYAFIKFDCKEDASAAFDKLNGNIACGGCSLRLGWAKVTPEMFCMFITNVTKL